jgi:ribosomal protein S18 acetylase RimI-like enzyme
VLLESGNGVLRVARSGGVGIGHVLLLLGLTEWVERTVLSDHADPRMLAEALRARGSGLITDLLVVPSHRRQGVGAALVEDALGLARAAGLAEVALFVSGDNLPALRLYERLGFKARTEWPHVIEYTRALG